MKTLRVHPLGEAEYIDRYDLFVAALGFETRARYVAEKIRPESYRAVALAFPDRQVLAFHENRNAFHKLAFTISELSDSDVLPYVSGLLSEVPVENRSEIAVAVDVSSMSRVRIAALVDAFRNFNSDVKLVVDFFYAVAAFSPPPEEFSPNAHVGPVLPSFAGWSLEPDQPPVAVLGLGYEQDRALGAVELLQPGAIWAFLPRSSINEYSPELLKANSLLLEGLPSDRILGYAVERPFDCFVTLESLVFGLREVATPVLLPFGPKIFSVLSLLVATVHSPAVAVWRVSPGITETPQDRAPSGHVCSIRAVFAPPLYESNDIRAAEG